MLNKKKSKIVGYIIDCASLSLSAQIMIFPIIIYNFNTINLLFIVPNILISIFIGPCVMLGYLCVISSIVFKPLAIVIIQVETIVIQICTLIAKFSGKLPLSKIYITTPYLLEVLLIYAFLMYGVEYYIDNRYMALRKMVLVKNAVVRRKGKNV